MSQMLFMFPGQGSQTPGMLEDFATHPSTKELLEQASDTLGTNMASLMAPGADAAMLQDTRNAQPALLTIGYLAASYLLAQSGKPLPHWAGFVAGHSIGEYTAAAVAGCLTFPAALKLVQLRANAMAQAVPAGQGGMSAIIGLDAEVLKSALANIANVFIANDNAPGQIIISGAAAALNDAEEAAKSAGAKRVLRLNVSGPFHTPAMQPAAGAVAAFLAQNPLQPPAVPLIMNATAQPADDPQQIAANLAAQTTAPVCWRESLQHAAESGLAACLELGPGKVLAGLAPRCHASLSATSLGSRAAIDTWLEANL